MQRSQLVRAWLLIATAVAYRPDVPADNLVPLDTDTFGFEGLDEAERAECMKAKAARPTGKLEFYQGTKLPSTVEVTSIDVAPVLQDTLCLDCGIYEVKQPSYCVREVPKLIHFVWLDNPLPMKYAQNIMNIMRVNSDYKFLLWVNEGGQDVSALTDAVAADDSMSWPEVHVQHVWKQKDEFMNWDIIDKEPNVGARSDWIRLEAVYRFGGIYMDTDSAAVHAFSDYAGIFRWPFVAQSDPEGFYHNLCNCVFGAEKQSPLLRSTIKGWREGVLHHQLLSSAPGGCDILTAAFVVNNDPEIMMISEWNIMKRKAGVDPVMFMSFDGSWVN